MKRFRLPTPARGLASIPKALLCVCLYIFFIRKGLLFWSYSDKGPAGFGIWVLNVVSKEAFVLSAGASLTLNELNSKINSAIRIIFVGCNYLVIGISKMPIHT